MHPRESFGSRLGFLMATAGSAIGLGALWKFPYVTGENGGGAFVLAFIFFTLIIGMPIFIGELIIGRITERSPVLAFAELKSKWKILGWMSVIAPLLVLSYYIVVAGWALNYALMSLLNFSVGKSTEEIQNSFEILYGSWQINLFWTFLFLALTAGVVYRGVRKGIELWSKILMPILFLLLIGLLIYSFTLPGFKEGFSFVFKPDFSKLKPSSILEALGLACFTLSVGMGVLITYGSYMQSKDDIPKTTVTVALMNLFVSLVAGLVIFPIIFTFGFPPSEGPGLLFKTLPVLFAKLPGTLIISTTFFLLVVFAALTSTISVMEVLVATVTELYDWSRQKASIIVSSIVFLLAIPSSVSGSNTLFKSWENLYGKTFFQTIDAFSNNWLLPLNAILTSIFLGWVLDKTVQKNAFYLGSRWSYTFKAWAFLVRWIVPLGVGIIILQHGGFLNFLRGE